MDWLLLSELRLSNDCMTEIKAVWTRTGYAHDTDHNG